MIPPPNVTGSLHLGHGLTNAIEDCLVRWHRMRGFETLWLPGVDHAGIATQVVVEKLLKKETGQSRHDLGRENFLKKVWEWKERSGGIITKQMHRLGISVDWTREAFTMDDKCSAAVKEAFIRMSNSGKIFRATRLINWDCTLNTAVSNIEIDYIELKKRTRLEMPGFKETVLFGAIWEFAYPVKDSKEQIIIATTRPETMLGDTAVAVHPDDPRFKHLIGKTVVHPFCKRELPIIADPILVKMGLGTGAVKITPAHDHNDYECGKRHNLRFLNILNDDGTINAEGGEFAGMHRWEVRKQIIIRLKELHLFREVKDHEMTLGICSRSKDVLEPLIKPQWFVDCREMARKATEAVQTGELEIYPKYFEADWYRWMENTEDWCISRQLWWGHRIPAYLIHLKDRPEPDPNDAQWWITANDEAEARKLACDKFQVKPEDVIRIVQDPDVLDTWFSSALFPFSTLGWPNETPDFKAFYPGSVLETGWDILFFWVAKMVFFGQELTGQLPFKHVFLHAMVRDAEGNKMSKSLGNVIDPLDIMDGASLEKLHDTLRHGNLDAQKVDEGIRLQKKMYGPTNGIPECGADGMRFALCHYTGQGRNINMSVKLVQTKRFFCDKLWNIVRFAALSIPSTFTPIDDLSTLKGEDLIDRWILSTLARCTEELNANLRGYNFFQATDALESWWRDCLADVYLEAIKPRTKGTDEASKLRASHVLHTCLDLGLKLTHPFMPFVTEELWQRLPRRKGDPESIMISAFPTAESTSHWRNIALEQEASWILQVSGRTRSAKDSYRVTRKQDPAITYVLASQEKLAVIQAWLPAMLPLVYSSTASCVLQGQADTKGCAMQVVDDNCQVLVRLAGLGLDYGQELQKLRKEVRQKVRIIASLEAQMENPSYAKRPQEVKDKETAQLNSLKAEVQLTQLGINDFTRLLADEGLPIPDEVVTPEVVKKKKGDPDNNGKQQKKKEEEGGDGDKATNAKAQKKAAHAAKSKAKGGGDNKKDGHDDHAKKDDDHKKE